MRLFPSYIDGGTRIWRLWVWLHLDCLVVQVEVHCLLVINSRVDLEILGLTLAGWPDKRNMVYWVKCPHTMDDPYLNYEEFLCGSSFTFVHEIHEKLRSGNYP